MPDFNRVILMGNLTRDPEFRYTSNNKAVVQCGMAINRKWKDNQEVCFVDFEAWGRTAEVINKYCHKGDPLHIEGRLKLDQWTDASGTKRSKLKVVAETMQFINRGSSNGEGGGARQGSASSRSGGDGPHHQPETSSSSGGGGEHQDQMEDGSKGPHKPVDEDDIPF